MADVDSAVLVPGQRGDAAQAALPVDVAINRDEQCSIALAPEVSVDMSALSSFQYQTTLSDLDMSRAHSGYSEVGVGSHLALLSHQTVGQHRPTAESLLHTSTPPLLGGLQTTALSPSKAHARSTGGLQLKSDPAMDRSSMSVSSIRLHADAFGPRRPCTPVISPTVVQSSELSEFDRVLEDGARHMHGVDAHTSTVTQEGNIKVMNEKKRAQQSGKGRHVLHMRGSATKSTSSVSSTSAIKLLDSSGSVPPDESPLLAKAPLKRAHKNSHATNLEVHKHSADIGLGISCTQDIQSHAQPDQQSLSPRASTTHSSPTTNLSPEFGFTEKLGVQPERGLQQVGPPEAVSGRIDPDANSSTAARGFIGTAGTAGFSTSEQPVPDVAPQGVFRDALNVSSSVKSTPQSASVHVGNPRPGQSSLATVPEESPLADTVPLSRPLSLGSTPRSHRLSPAHLHQVLLLQNLEAADSSADSAPTVDLRALSDQNLPPYEGPSNSCTLSPTCSTPKTPTAVTLPLPPDGSSSNSSSSTSLSTFAAASAAASAPSLPSAGMRTLFGGSPTEDASSRPLSSSGTESRDGLSISFLPMECRQTGNASPMDPEREEATQVSLGTLSNSSSSSSSKDDNSASIHSSVESMGSTTTSASLRESVRSITSSSDSNASTTPRSDGSSRPLTPLAINSSEPGKICTGTKKAENSGVTTNTVASVMYTGGSMFTAVLTGTIPKSPINRTASLPGAHEITGESSMTKDGSTRFSSALSIADVPTSIPNGRSGSAMRGGSTSAAPLRRGAKSADASLVDGMLQTVKEDAGTTPMAVTASNSADAAGNESTFLTPQGSSVSQVAATSAQNWDSRTKASSTGNSSFGTAALSVTSVRSLLSVADSQVSQTGAKGSTLQHGRSSAKAHSRGASFDMRDTDSGMGTLVAESTRGTVCTNPRTGADDVVSGTMKMYRTVSESGITRISTAVDGTSVDTHPVHAHMHSRSGDEGPALEPQPRADCGQHTCVHNPQMNINAQEVELKVTSQVVGLWEGPAGNISRPDKYGQVVLGQHMAEPSIDAPLGTRTRTPTLSSQAPQPLHSWGAPVPRMHQTRTPLTHRSTAHATKAGPRSIANTPSNGSAMHRRKRAGSGGIIACCMSSPSTLETP